ncbi:helix-turn-helix domain-containing protein [Nitrospirillum amazonense]|uniref:helix-turn-helix domain-containing protein n=1 Tax=Nitrospirillum amazonense TaxID=28077 RepID=UPI00241260E9|nr:helix-turn-helix transcriptional regulator [Nitrospirillum amazonense]MDG3439561.1 helix-turn-helix transcriptional regulator [Nitrospirillum amazonense]
MVGLWLGLCRAYKIILSYNGIIRNWDYRQNRLQQSAGFHAQVPSIAPATATQSLLIELRKAKGLTQTEVATRLRRPQSFVAKYEGGERRLDVVEFIEVAQALEADACLVLGELIQRSPSLTTE